jgi:hypothetical protein
VDVSDIVLCACSYSDFVLFLYRIYIYIYIYIYIVVEWGCWTELMFNSVFATTILGCIFRCSLSCLLCRDLLSVCNMVMCVDVCCILD